MTGMMVGTGRKGRPCRECIEDNKDGCTARPMYTVLRRSPKTEEHGKVRWQVQWTPMGFQLMDKKKIGEDDRLQLRSLN